MDVKKMSRRELKSKSVGVSLLLSLMRDGSFAEMKSKEKETATLDDARAVLDQLLTNVEAACSVAELPEYSFVERPKLVAQIDNLPSSSTPNNFYKGCKWSPDGSLLLTSTEDRCLRVYRASFPSAKTLRTNVNPSSTVSLELVSNSPHGELVYDFAWYPFAHAAAPELCMFASTSRDQPIHMVDALTGKVLTSYRPLNHVEELHAAHSLCFSHDATKIYAGCLRSIRIFDVSRPGTTCTAVPTYNKIHRNSSKKAGQHGIISCVAVGNEDVFAAGSYDRTIGIYSTNSSYNGAEFLISPAYHLAGVTHLKFSTCGNYLYSGGRKDPLIHCWDLRSLSRPMRSFERVVTTNQRVTFDLTANELVTGSSDGYVRVFSLDDETRCAKYPSHRSCVNGVALNPVVPVLATCSGQRMLKSVDSDEEDSEDIITVENSLKLWWCGN